MNPDKKGGMIPLNEVSALELIQVSEDIFEYVKNLNLSGIELPWDVETFQNSTETRLCFKRLDDAEIISNYVNGSYLVKLPFIISCQSTLIENKSMPVTNILNIITKKLINEKANSFNDFILRDAKVEDIVISESFNDCNIKDLIRFNTKYNLIYSKKGRYE